MTEVALGTMPLAGAFTLVRQWDLGGHRGWRERSRAPKTVLHVLQLCMVAGCAESEAAEVDHLDAQQHVHHGGGPLVALQKQG